MAFQYLRTFPRSGNLRLDRDGIVRHVFSSQLGVEKHVEEALIALRSIS